MQEGRRTLAGEIKMNRNEAEHVGNGKPTSVKVWWGLKGDLLGGFEDLVSQAETV